MNYAVLDTSVVVKWFHRENEEDVDKALLLRQAYLEGALNLIVPDLLMYEFGNFLRFRTGLKPADQLASIRSLWSLGMEIHPIDSLLSEQMVQLASRHDITVYDAAFVALSQSLSAPLVTADRMLHEKCGKKHAVILLAQVEGA
ncbi:MAG: type II toxin-antitoxin system VapC family toxin [Thermoleophilia bacterium]|nr:type II toxin-antitoxin system VapC family toxin [Thermoleophilia bacterium]